MVRILSYFARLACPNLRVHYKEHQNRDERNHQTEQKESSAIAPHFFER
jgi:hypothetical protein